MLRPFKIFISYRREDAIGHAGRLYDRLVKQFGESNVFIDVDNIPAGSDFAQVIRAAVSSCRVLLVIISRGWLSSKDQANGRRLDNEKDFVRLEIEAALSRGITIIPVLVQGAQMPQARDLPLSLAALAERQAIELSDSRWPYDLGRLLSVLKAEKRRVPEAPKEKPPLEPRRLASIVSVGNASLAAALAMLLGFLWMAYQIGSRAQSGDLTAVGPAQPMSSDSAQPQSQVPGAGRIDTSAETSSADPGRIRVLRAGTSIRLESPNAFPGTICCFVRDDHNQVYLLTSQFAFPGGRGDWVIQPVKKPMAEAGERIAVLSRSLSPLSGEENISAGLALLLPGVQASPEIDGIGPITGVAPDVHPGEPVTVIGGISGVVRTIVEATHINGEQFKTPLGVQTFNELIEIKSSFRLGDPGAPVINGKNQLVGVVLAGSEMSISIMPIVPILQKFKVTLLDAPQASKTTPQSAQRSHRGPRGS